jgi:Zn-dependent peptidase ImmA (M78 family)/transcriptional regulator with XRE-family HTH domain
VWARERSGIGRDALVHRFPKLPEWEEGRSLPTLKQLEVFAQATHTPVGFLFLPEPPEESISIPDLRTMGGARPQRPSPDLLDTLFQCQQRQEWYHDFVRANGGGPIQFVGSMTRSTNETEAASIIRRVLNFDFGSRGANWTEALRQLVDKSEAQGVLVMINGVVGSNTHRKLDPEEFRGLALVDNLAPLIFVNGADTKAAQIFTLIHELAHIWLGETALSSASARSVPANDIEGWCNRVAAEVLVPIDALSAEFDAQADLTAELDRLASRFKVSTLVVLRRVHDAGYFTPTEFQSAYRAELERVLAILETKGGAKGGNFYNTQPLRVSQRFARALIGSTLEGQTLYRDTVQMLGFKKLSTFHELAHKLGAM